jgi:aminoglycoside phosphotransferase family enzyme
MVTVRKDVPGLDALPPGVSAETEISAKATEEAVQRSMLLMERAKKVKPPIPLKYADMQTSDLRKEVVEGENVINIELTH